MKLDVGSSETELLGHPMKSYDATIKEFMTWYTSLPE